MHEISLTNEREMRVLMGYNMRSDTQAALDVIMSCRRISCHIYRGLWGFSARFKVFFFVFCFFSKEVLIKTMKQSFTIMMIMLSYTLSTDS